MSSVKTRYDRLETRITPELKELFQEAADLRGVTLTDFVISTVHDAAIQTVEQHKVIKLNRAASLQFAEALSAPPKANSALRSAAQRYRKVVVGK